MRTFAELLEALDRPADGKRHDFRLHYASGIARLKAQIYGPMAQVELARAGESLRRAFLLVPDGHAMRDRILRYHALCAILACARDRGRLARILRRTLSAVKRRSPGGKREASRNVRFISNLLECLQGRVIPVLSGTGQCSAEETLCYCLLGGSAFAGTEEACARSLCGLKQCDGAFACLVGSTSLRHDAKVWIVTRLMQNNFQFAVKSLMMLQDGRRAMGFLTRAWVSGPSQASMTGLDFFFSAVESGAAFRLSMEQVRFIYTAVTNNPHVLTALSGHISGMQSASDGNAGFLEELLQVYDGSTNGVLADSYLDYVAVHPGRISDGNASAAVLRRIAEKGSRVQRARAGYLLAAAESGWSEDPPYYPCVTSEGHIAWLSKRLDEMAADRTAHFHRLLWMANTYAVRLPFADRMGRPGDSVSIRFTFADFREGALGRQTYFLHQRNYYCLPEPPAHVIVCDCGLPVRCGGADAGMSDMEVRPLSGDLPRLADVLKQVTEAEYSALIADASGAARLQSGPFLFPHMAFLTALCLFRSMEFRHKGAALRKSMMELFIGCVPMFNDWVILPYMHYFNALAEDDGMSASLKREIRRINTKYALVERAAVELTMEQLNLLFRVSNLLVLSDRLDGDDEQARQAVGEMLRDGTGFFSPIAADLCYRMIRKGSIFEFVYVAYLEKYFDEVLMSANADEEIVYKVLARSAAPGLLTMKYKKAVREIDSEYVIAVTEYYRENGRRLDGALVDAVKMLVHGPMPFSPTEDLLELMRSVLETCPDYAPLANALAAIDRSGGRNDGILNPVL